MYSLATLARYFETADVGDFGGNRLDGRSLEPHVRALAEYGVTMQKTDSGWHLGNRTARLAEFPLSARLAGITATALALLVAASLEGRSVIRQAGNEIEILDLLDCVTTLGAEAHFDETALMVKGPMAAPRPSWNVSGDSVFCGTLAIASALTGGEIRMPASMIGRMSSILLALQKSGFLCQREDHTLKLSGRATHAINWHSDAFPGFPSDLAPHMVLLMTHVFGISRYRESVYRERFSHVPALRSLGDEIACVGNHCTITGHVTLRGTEVAGSGIRETAALALAGLNSQGETTISPVNALYRGHKNPPNDLIATGASIRVH